jgi:Type ISP C-terminal specificity domain/N-6 DNA Methylase
MTVPKSLNEAISSFGVAVKAKLAGQGALGEPEDQLRAPFEALLADVVTILGFGASKIVAVGESKVTDLKTRPDYAITRMNALVGFIELKAPGKGADPRVFKDEHDKKQWAKLRSLPNLIFTDGNSFSLWRSGELDGGIIHLEGSIQTAGAKLRAPEALLRLFKDFLLWEPIPPETPWQLARLTAHLCRLLRDEVTEQLEFKNEALTALAEDWRRLLFPTASDEQFADGYAQAVTFGLLMARARSIDVAEDFDEIAKELASTNTVIGRALLVLTDDVSNQEALRTSLGTLKAVLSVVDWFKISKGNPEAWLYFYEDFLNVYDSKLRRKTGSYYTPPEVVTAMVRLAESALRDPMRFGLPDGLASACVTLADPAVGTGTFLLEVLRRIAEATAEDLGLGAVPAVIQASLKRIIGFELQFGPFSVAQLRLLAEVTDLIATAGGEPEKVDLRLYLTDTLGNPYAEKEYIPAMLQPLAASRLEANRIKREEPITVVIGNPPYRERAKGLGGWIESGTASTAAPLKAWVPPTEWKVSAHAKHLRNLYVYFWRWATWKVFGDGAPTDPKCGIVSFITVAGFLNGPGFEKMRADLRREASEIWVIDCSPEGHQSAVANRIFQGVQHPVCIVTVVRLANGDPGTPAPVRFRALPPGRREHKFAALQAITLDGQGWIDAASDWRAPFLPAAAGAWSTFPRLEAFFGYNGSGVMPGRTWVIAPDADSLRQRWDRLVSESNPGKKELLFHPHGSPGELGDRHTNKVPEDGLPGHEFRGMPVAKDHGCVVSPVRYGFRSFDRQWIVPDKRLINRPNPRLWSIHSSRQAYLTALERHSPRSGPGVTFSGLVPDLHHYKGSFGGRVFPLWLDAAATITNVAAGVLSVLTSKYEQDVAPQDVFAYIAAVAAHPAYTSRFAADLVQPGLRIPLTADPELFAEAAALGREVVWLHTFGERFTDPDAGRPASPPRMAKGAGPTIPSGGAIPPMPGDMPDTINHDKAACRLWVGKGHIDNVAPEVWAYEVSGMQVLTQWFSYRKRNRQRPLIGDKRPPSPLGDIQPDHWVAEYTAELMNVLHVLGRLVMLEPKQADLLDRICAAGLVAGDVISDANAKAKANAKGEAKPADVQDDRQTSLLD